MSDNANATVPSMKTMLEAGVHFGHQSTRWNPKMKKFIYIKKDGIHIIDLAKTHQQLINAVNYLQELSRDKKTVLFIGTKKQAIQIVKQYAAQIGMPYIVNRWIGGLLTNYKIVSKNINRLNQLKKDLDNPEFLAKYTKKEIQEFKVEYNELNKLYEGVKNMTKLPDAVFVVDAHHENTAVLEAKRKKIPIISLIDTNTNPDLINYPIPGNDDSYKSLELIVKTIAAAFTNTQNIKS
ncbi:MAG: 30S ribosomal protein S2 [Patescibacteria group bacterium]